MSEASVFVVPRPIWGVEGARLRLVAQEFFSKDELVYLACCSPRSGHRFFIPPE